MYTPIFATGKKDEPNQIIGFRKDFSLENEPGALTLHLTARSFYRLYVNGSFVCHGPARAGFGHVRMDEIDILPYTQPGVNHLAIEVASYGDAYRYSNDITCEPGLLICSLICDGEELFKTDESWRAKVLPQRRTQVDRYSHCREISELYDLDEDYYLWRVSEIDGPVEVLADCPEILPRGMAYPLYTCYDNFAPVEFGSVVKDAARQVPPLFYERPEGAATIPERPSVICAQEAQLPLAGTVTKQGDEYTVTCGEGTDGTYLLFDAERMITGFKGIVVKTDGAATIDILHAEQLEEDGRLPERPSMSVALRLHVGEGEWSFLSFEPYTFRYLKIVCRSKGAVTVSPFAVDYMYPDNKEGFFFCSDDDLNRIYKAARATLQLNTLDIFMDCPDRERGGWLCDSFWTSRAQKMLFGDTDVEKAMLEDFLHHPRTEQLKGLVPQVYPALCPDNRNGATINTWAMWLMLEVFEYVRRSGDTAMLEAYRENMTALIDGLWEHKNKAGLLENIPGFTFIDWSSSNNRYYNSPISVPANCLYAKMALQAGEAYGNDEWTKRAETIVAAVKKFAVGDYFHDALEACNDDGICAGKGLYSESGNYTTLWTGFFDRADYQRIFDGIVHSYGPCATKAKNPAMLAPGEMFIGYCIRHDLLSQLGEAEVLVREIYDICGKMLSAGPGTLWESFNGYSSRCHGFTSHFGFLLMKDVLGLGQTDEVAKTVPVAPHPCGLAWAKGTAALKGGLAQVSWKNSDAAFELTVHVPEGYRLQFDFSGVYTGKNSIYVNGKLVQGPVQIAYEG